MLGSFRETEDEYVPVDSLVVSLLDCVGLVEDADRAVGTDEPVKVALGGEVRVVRVPGEPFDVHKRTPVLDQHGSQPCR